MFEADLLRKNFKINLPGGMVKTQSLFLRRYSRVCTTQKVMFPGRVLCSPLFVFVVLVVIQIHHRLITNASFHFAQNRYRENSVRHNVGGQQLTASAQRKKLDCHQFADTGVETHRGQVLNDFVVIILFGISTFCRLTLKCN